jgi:hypothetical protein
LHDEAIDDLTLVQLLRGGFFHLRKLVEDFRLR